MQIKNSVFLVTGGASGLGAATARMAAENGGKVVIADLQPESGEKLARELNGRFVKCDVTSEADGKAAVALALKEFGGLHVLVNCAGIALAERTSARSCRTTSALPEGRQRERDRHVQHDAARRRRHGEGLAQRRRRGVIVNTASVAAFDGQIGQAAYSASKGAIVGMTLPIARDLSRNGIRVCSIAPGIFETPMLAGLPQDAQDSLGKQVPFPSRLGRPAEYAPRW